MSHLNRRQTPTREQSLAEFARMEIVNQAVRHFSGLSGGLCRKVTKADWKDCFRHARQCAPKRQNFICE